MKLNDVLIQIAKEEGFEHIEHEGVRDELKLKRTNIICIVHECYFPDMLFITIRSKGLILMHETMPVRNNDFHRFFRITEQIANSFNDAFQILNEECANN